MRLVGPNDAEGRVEYCSNGVWGTVSYYGFDVNDGKVICRKLGHQEPRNLNTNFVTYFISYFIQVY